MSFPSGLKKSVHEAIDHLTAVDPIFNSIIEKWSASNSRTSTRIETLVLLILEQQVSIDSAKATFKIKGKDKNLRPVLLMDLSDQEF
jgi:DNA-3-methyladenine glycosylase II